MVDTTMVAIFGPVASVAILLVTCTLVLIYSIAWIIRHLGY